MDRFQGHFYSVQKCNEQIGRHFTMPDHKVTKDMSIYTDEIFGPVMNILPFSDVGVAVSPQPNEPGRLVDFDRDVRPIFSDHCYQCHGPDG